MNCYSKPQLIFARSAFQPILILWIGAWASLAWSQVVPLQHRWEADPGFGDVWNISREPRAKFLNVEDLVNEQAIVRFEAAQNICQNYDKPGFRKSARAMELLIDQLGNPKNSLMVRRAMISAACLLDDGQNAESIWRASINDPGAAPLVESYLIRWKSPVALEHWRKVVSESTASQSDVENALDGLAQVGQQQDRELCLSVLRSNQSAAVTQLAAARALGRLQSEGLGSLARDILGSDIAQKHLLAASILAQHQENEILEILESILEGGSSPAKRSAANSIATNFATQALAMAGKWVKDPDDEIRLAALKLLNSTPSEQNTRIQATLLADPDPVVRKLARSQLLDSAGKGFRSVVDESITEHLSGQAWQGIEQSIVLAVELGDRSRCPRFLELLEHEKPEVNMHAAWGLMELANEPAILDAMVPHATKLTAELESGKLLKKQDIIRLSFLFEAFGRNDYEPVLDMLRKYIPKDNFKMGNLSRASAIWAIGKIMKGQDDPKLRSQLSERIADLSSRMPENYLVGYACLLTLGEFGFLDSKAIVERYTAESQDGLNSAGRWAKEQIEKAAR